MPIQIPKVNKEEAKNFSKLWNFKGVALIVDEPLCQFAADFANVVLNSFVQQLMQKQAEDTKPKIQIVES